MNGGPEKVPIGRQQLSEAYGDSGASSSKKNPGATESESGKPKIQMPSITYVL